MRNAVFLVKNGIGFGHIRRALILAEALQIAGRLRPIIISQANSLALYHRSPVQVVNLPLLQRLPSEITEDFYLDVLEGVLDRLDPAVVVEDTYPDPRYRALRALADRPRVLVMRRLDGLSLNQIRRRGDLAHFDRILIAQDRAGFDQEGHTGQTLTAVDLSPRFTFVGNIARSPRPGQVAAIRSRYAPDGVPLVVVNGGAGGDQLHDGYGHRLFHACHLVARSLAADGILAHFALVTGPYYAGAPLPPTPNVTVQPFEPHLPELLAAADVAVIKPGNNALSEVLTGAAQLILVPDRSFMEGLDEHSARTVARYGGAIARPEAAHLEPLIRAALAQPPREQQSAPASSAVDRVVQELHEQADGHGPDRVPERCLLLVLVASTDPDATMHLPRALQDAVVASADGSLTHRTLRRDEDTFSIIMTADPPSDRPQTLVDRGVRLILRVGSSAAIDHWLKEHPARPALLDVKAEHVTARSPLPHGAKRRITQQLRTRPFAVTILDLSQLAEAEQKEYLDHLGEWTARQPLRLLSPGELAAQLADQWLEP